MRIRSRRSTALLVSLAMTAGLLAFAAPASADVANPGAVTFTANDGVVKVGDADGTGIALPLTCDPAPGILPEFPAINVADLVADDCDPSAPLPEMVGTVDAAGNLDFAPFTLLDGDPIDVGPEMGLPANLAFLEMNVVAPGGATGLIEPFAGNLSIDVGLEVQVNLTGALGNHACALGFDLAMAGPYNMTTGKGLVADNQFTFDIPEDPAVCAPLIAGLAGDIVGDTTTAGINVVRLGFDVDPVLFEEVDPFAPEVGDLEATIPLGDSTQRTIPVSWHPAGECALDGADGGAEKGTATLLGLVITYTNNGVDAGEDTVDYTCTNDEGSDSGTLTVTILDNSCTAGQPDQPAGGCSLNQLIEFEIEGAELSMSQNEANVTLGTITLNGAPQTTTGDLNTVTVVNKRGDGQAWDLSGQVSDFKTGGHEADCPANVPSSWDYRCIPGSNLGWSPAAEVVHEVVPGDVAAVTPGSDIDPSDIAAGLLASNGLGTHAHTLCSAAETFSGGTFACGAGLALVVPASASSGTYNATLTLTLS